MIFLILILAFILRIISLNQSLWFDEAINIQAAKSFSLFGMVTQYAVADFHPPGWFVILWVWTKLFGYSEIITRIPSVVFGVITVYAIYLIGKKLVSSKVGLIAAILLSINPLHIYYSQEARMYSLATLAVSVNIYLLIKLIKGEKVNLIFLTFGNLLVLLSDYIAYFIFPAQFIFLLLAKKEFLKKWIMALIAAVLLGIWWLPIFLGQLNVGSIASANLPTWKFVAGAFDLKMLPLTFVKFIIGRISLANKLIYGATLLPICILFSFLIFRGFRLVKGVPRKLLISWIVVPLIVATAISILVPVYNYFRVLYIIPAFIILISLGILSFNNKLKYFFLGLVFSIELFCTFVYLLNPLYQREDWKGLVSFFKSIQPPIILLESSGTFPSFDYYAGRTLNAKGALTDFPAKDETAVAKLDNYKDVYLINYLVEISDPQRLVDKKLKSMGYKINDTTDFHGVGFVYHYVK